MSRKYESCCWFFVGFFLGGWGGSILFLVLSFPKIKVFLLDMEITWIISSLPHSLLGVTFLRKEAHLSQNTTVYILLHCVPLSFGRKNRHKMKGFFTIDAIKPKQKCWSTHFPMLKGQNFPKVLKKSENPNYYSSGKNMKFRDRETWSSICSRTYQLRKLQTFMY